MKGLIAADKTFSFRKNFLKPYSAYILNGDGTFTERKNVQTIQVSESFFQFQNITTEASINYDLVLGKHSIRSLLLYTQTQNTADNLSASRSGLPSILLDQLSLGSPTTATNDGTASEDSRQSVVGRLNYKFADRYLVDFSFRYDGSDVFSPGNRFGFFPALGAGWIISQEPFFKNIGFINYLKLRGSYGQAGNDRVGQFQYLQGYTSTAFYAFGGPTAAGVAALQPGVIPNSDFTWERAKISNLGLDFTMLNGKLTVESDFFYKRTDHILVPFSAAIPAVIGGTLAPQNGGKVDSKGFEIQLSYQQRNTKLQYYIKPNFTFSQSKVIEYPEAEGLSDNLKKVGKKVSIDALIGYKAIGLYQSVDHINASPTPLYSNTKPGDIQYADINKDGKIDANDRIIITNGSTPEIIYGINLGATYRRFELSIFLQGAGNVETYLDGQLNQSFYAGIQRAFKYQTDRWTMENPNASYPRLTVTSQNNRESSSYWVRNSAYIRLKNVEISYTIPQKTISSWGLESIRAYVSGANLLTISRLKITDPETGASARAYPILRVFNFGLTVEF